MLGVLFVCLMLGWKQNDCSGVFASLIASVSFTPSLPFHLRSKERACDHHLPATPRYHNMQSRVMALYLPYACLTCTKDQEKL